MILRVLAVSMIGFTLAGCVSNSACPAMFTPHPKPNRSKV